MESEHIEGLMIADLKVFGDSRGNFREVFRREWFPQRSWDKLQSNGSRSKQGVLRGLHYHFKQVDYWYVAEGMLRAALFDMRPDSSTYMATHTIDMGGENEIGIFIPVGVAHGFAALTDVSMFYFVDNYYDGEDEFGVAWNDPALGIDWGVVDPIVSERDQTNLPYAQLDRATLPRQLA